MMRESGGFNTEMDKIALKTISIVFCESDDVVLKSADYLSEVFPAEKISTYCDKRRDPFVFSTVPQKKLGEEVIDMPLKLRKAEMDGYAARTVRFERSMEAASDLYRVTCLPEETKIQVTNEGKRALRFQMPDGRILRVPAGWKETIWSKERPQEVTAEVCPTAKVRIIVDAATEMTVSSLEQAADGGWEEIGAVTDNTALLNDYLLRIRGIGGNLLGVLQTTTAYSGRPAVSFVDCKRYGAEFSIRNAGIRPVLLYFPEYGTLAFTLEPNSAEYTFAEALQRANSLLPLTNDELLSKLFRPDTAE